MGDPLMRWALLLTLLLATGACDSLNRLLDVQPQDRVPVDAVDNPSQASLLANGVEGTFDCAYQADVVIQGILTDELDNSQGNEAFANYDRRDQSPHGGLSGIYAIGDCYVGGGVTVERFGLYKPVNSARWFADYVLDKLDSWSPDDVPDRDDLIARVATYDGYSHILLGEAFCSAAIDGGPEITPAEVFARGEGKFTEAIQAAQSAGDAQMLGLAYLGRARIRLDMGNMADAAADARQVPQGFSVSVTASNSTFTRYNRMYQFNNQNGWVTVGPAYRGLEFKGVPDPRVPVTNTGSLGSDNRTPLWVQGKYTALSSSTPLATWEEAQLIIAEAVGGQEAVDIINELHTMAGLPAFVPADASDIQQHLNEERRRVLFLQAHRMWDIHRLNLPLDPPAGSPYPGAIAGSYGSTTCLPLPDVERDANPNIGS